MGNLNKGLRAVRAIVLFIRTKGWKTLGALFTISIAIAGVYSGFFYERRPNLKFEILNNSSVLDVKEDVSKLDILYDGKSIKRTNKALTIMTVNIVNDGNASILLSHFDNKDPVRISITEGAIVEDAEILDASNNYLKEKVKLSTFRDNIIFSNFIMDPNDFIKIKILVLHNINVKTTIMAIGKIATIKRFEITNYESARITFWDKPLGIAIKWGSLIIFGIISILVLMFFGKIFSDVLKKTIGYFVQALYEQRINRKLLPIDYLMLEMLNSKTEKAVFLLGESSKHNDFTNFRKKYSEFFNKLIEIEVVKIQGSDTVVSEKDSKIISE
ncbi:MAG TPA: hypothetical protein VHP63_00095, partial [candidate division Zixibacteria bacterium]|nr:hypothetical protein [candidate division Zixibacteria bacterium]